MMNFKLSEESYTVRNALFWGNCIGHFKEACHGYLGKRVVNGIIAILELFPIVSQVVSIAEYVLIHNPIHEELINFEKTVLQQNHQFEKANKELKQKIKKLEDFVKSTPELKEACLEHFQSHGQYMINLTPPKFVGDPNDIIDRRTYLDLTQTYLNTKLREYIRFMQSSQTVMDRFRRHIHLNPNPNI